MGKGRKRDLHLEKELKSPAWSSNFTIKIPCMTRGSTCPGQSLILSPGHIDAVTELNLSKIKLLKAELEK